jgi:hypothetical protein
METSGQSLTGVSGRFPLLWLTRVQGHSREEAMERLGLTRHGYRVQYAAEVAEFTAWAYRNRRVSA